VLIVHVGIVESSAGGGDALQSSGIAAAAIGDAIGGLTALVKLAVLFLLLKKKNRKIEQTVADGELEVEGYFDLDSE
jgi:hypothetical protein